MTYFARTKSQPVSYPSLLACATEPRDSQPTCTSSTRAPSGISLNVTVTDRANRFVLDLDLPELSVFEDGIKKILGVVLLVAAVAMLVKIVVQSRRNDQPEGMMDQRLVRAIPTLIVGVIGGFIVGMTSVGSGSLMITSS